MIYENIVIGAGPIGMYLAGKLNNCLLIEATNQLGGQLCRLYPEKEIVDIPNIPSIKAIDYIKLLSTKINKDNVRLNEKVIQIVDGEPIKVITAKNKYLCKNLIICVGLGFSTPRKMGLENEDECNNILYRLTSMDFLKNKKVAIFGGGDSALDWAKALSKITPNPYLIHRRDEFRGNVETIKNCDNLKIYLSYIPFKIIKEGNKAKQIIIKNVKDESTIALEVDYILVNFGNIAEITNFGFENNNSFIKTNDGFRITKHIFACGDCVDYLNKKRRIAPGNKEADKILNLIG